MNRTNDLMMKRMKKSLALMLLAMVLLLSACGQKPVFGVSTNEDNSIRDRIFFILFIFTSPLKFQQIFRCR